jgi:hypothetical protein
MDEIDAAKKYCCGQYLFRGKFWKNSHPKIMAFLRRMRLPVCVGILCDVLMAG